MTPQERVLQDHQPAEGGRRCRCGADTILRGQAQHQVAELFSAGYAVLPVHGSAGVVKAAAAVVGAMGMAWSVPAHAVGGRSLTDALVKLREAVEDMAP